MRRLRHEGEKTVEDALMIPDTLPALLTVAKAATSLPWHLGGSLAASCWMESRATTLIEIVVPDMITQEEVLSRLGALTTPQGNWRSSTSLFINVFEAWAASRGGYHHGHDDHSHDQ